MIKQRVVRIISNVFNGIVAISAVSYLSKPSEKILAVAIVFLLSMLNFYDGLNSKP